MKELPDFFVMDKDQIIKWADDNGVDIDKRLPKDEAKAKEKLIDAILTELDSAENKPAEASQDDQTNNEPEKAQTAPVEAPIADKPASGTKSKMADIEINEIAQVWGKNLGDDFRKLLIKVDGDTLCAKLFTRHGEAMGEGKFTGPDERGVIGALEAAYKQMCGE